MARPRRELREPQELYRCVAPFVVYRGGLPVVYAGGDEVLGSDPILRTHPGHFEASVDRVLQRRFPSVEQATAAPGEVRTVTTPMRTPSVKEETENG